MTSCFIAMAILAVAMFVSACGSRNDERASGGVHINENKSINARSEQVRSTAPAANANSGEPGVPGPMDTETTSNSNSAQTPLQRKLDKLKKARDAANNAPATEPPKPNWQPAPEDSMVSITLTDVAIETRVFKSHPQLAKVEKIMGGDSKRILVYLRNGKVITLPGDKIQFVSSESAANILAAAGVTSGKPAKTRPTTKSGN